MSVLSKQVGGEHYKKRAIQPIEYIQANDLGFCEGNIVKYVTRHRDKGGREDIEKLIQYAKFILEEYDQKAKNQAMLASVEVENNFREAALNVYLTSAGNPTPPWVLINGTSADVT